MIEMDGKKSCWLYYVLFILSLLIGLILILKSYNVYIHFKCIEIHNLWQAYRLTPLGYGVAQLYVFILYKLKYYWFLDKAREIGCSEKIINYDNVFFIKFETRHWFWNILEGIGFIALQFVIDHFIPYTRHF